MPRNLYLRVMQRIVYFSMMILSIVMRKLVENFLGFKLGYISIDRNMIETQQEGWVGKVAIDYSITNSVNPIFSTICLCT